MQYGVKSLIKKDFLNTILKERGIDDPNRYIHSSIIDIEDPINFDNIEKGRLLLSKHLNNNSKIGLLVDCDCDGYTSAAIIYNFIHYYYPTIEIEYHIHEGKQHGLQDKVEIFLNKDYELLIVPDAGSNDFAEQKALNDKGMDILILDHHLVDNITEEWYNNDHTIIINNQLSKNYKNKALSGAGVTWQFCRYYEKFLPQNEKTELSYIFKDTPQAFWLMDLAAVGIIGDCMSMLGYENRAFAYYGLKEIHNEYLKAIIDKQSFSLKRTTNLSPTNVSFAIAPLINSIVRIGSISEKEKMFEAFIQGNKEVESTKRGAKGEKEKLSEQMAREGANAKGRQDTAVNKAMDIIDMKLQSEGILDENNLVIAELDDTMNFPATLNGLIAMKLADKYKKPVLVVREDEEGFLKGSARNDGKGELKDLRSLLINSNEIEYAQGHENAFGISFKLKKKDKFLDIVNKELSNYNFKDNFYEVSYCTTGKDDTISDFIFDVYKDDTIWGQKNDCPLIAVTNIVLKAKDIQICGTRKDTLRFKYNNITYIKFFASKDIEKITNAGEEINLTIIGEGALNEWAGAVSPQIIIKDYEIGGTIFDF